MHTRNEMFFFGTAMDLRFNRIISFDMQTNPKCGRKRRIFLQRQRHIYCTIHTILKFSFWLHCCNKSCQQHRYRFNRRSVSWDMYTFAYFNKATCFFAETASTTPICRLHSFQAVSCHNGIITLADYFFFVRFISIKSIQKIAHKLNAVLNASVIS